MLLKDNTRLHLESFGEGEPALIMLHGGPGGDSRPLERVASQIPGRVIIYDHRGMGKSDRSTPDKWNLNQWAEDLGEIVDSLDKPIVMGQSFGGFVALTYAVDNSNKLSGLVLSSTAARPGREEALAAFQKAGGEEARRAAKAFFDDPATGWDYFNQTCAKYYNRQDRGLMHLDEEILIHFQKKERREYELTQELHRVTCPSWVVTGEADPITPPPLSKEIADRLGGPVRLDIIPDAGHGIYRDNLDLFLSLLQEWRSSL